MTHNKPQTDIAGRVIGIFVVMGGLAILGYVFSIAVHLFRAPFPGLGIATGKGATAPPAMNIGAGIAEFFKELLLLGIMTVVGSQVASKGVELYFAALHGHQPQRDAPGYRPAPPETHP